VLTIGKLGASPDQLGYYEQQVAQGMEDYFSGRGEAPGRWAGRAAAALGVARKVHRDAFIRAMDGCDPRSGDRLRPAHGRTKVAAFDLTFSAPKSVSVLFAIADQETSAALMEAHRRAVAAAFAYVEREACFTRRGRNGVRRVRGDGFLAAAYRHRLSRAGDPHLHTHVVVANMTRAEGRWTSLEAHGIYEHKSAGGAVYRAVLRAEVRQRLPWVSWRRTGRGLFEIDGVPAALLREFSRRRIEIEERARELTGVSASSLSRERLQGIALATRKAKECEVDGARWQQEARARAAEHGLGSREVSQLAAGRAEADRTSDGEVVRDAVARLSGSAGLTEYHNTFARRHALAEIAGEYTQGARVAQLERTTRCYLEHGSVVALGRVDAEHRFTTRDLLACEQVIVNSAERRASEQCAALNPRLADMAPELNDEQREAVRALVTDGCGVSVLQALAGTGKTRTLGALAGVYEAAGYRVLGVAPTGRTARELSDAAGIPAFTIQRLLSELEESGGFARRTVVLFDEAGSAPTRPSADLFAVAERAGARLIAAGDSGQLPSVAAGGWFAAITKSLGGPELRQVMRQRDPAERQALEALHDGDPELYLELKSDRDQLTVHDHEHDAITALLADWDAAEREHGPGQAVMIARDNTTRAILNQLARQQLVQHGKIAPEGVVIADQEFRVGDRVIARRNDRYRDVDNGTLAHIQQIDEQTGTLNIITDTGQHRTLDASYVSNHLEQAHALTGHGAHGATVEWAGVIGRPSEFTREWAYTALTRARGQSHLHVICEPTARQRQREGYAPPEPHRTIADALQIMSFAMRRREAEPLTAEQLDPTALPTRDAVTLGVPVSELQEAGAELLSTQTIRAPEPDRRRLQSQRDRIASRGLAR
jgi:conjugative relaxase-like TrwC/TraI family protein